MSRSMDDDHTPSRPGEDAGPAGAVPGAPEPPEPPEPPGSPEREGRAGAEWRQDGARERPGVGDATTNGDWEVAGGAPKGPDGPAPVPEFTVGGRAPAGTQPGRMGAAAVTSGGSRRGEHRLLYLAAVGVALLLAAIALVAYRTFHAGALARPGVTRLQQQVRAAGLPAPSWGRIVRTAAAPDQNGSIPPCNVRAPPASHRTSRRHEGRDDRLDAASWSR